MANWHRTVHSHGHTFVFVEARRGRLQRGLTVKIGGVPRFTYISVQDVSDNAYHGRVEAFYSNLVAAILTAFNFAAVPIENGFAPEVEANGYSFT